MVRLSRQQKLQLIPLDFVVIGTLVALRGGRLPLRNLLIVAPFAVAIANLAYAAGIRYSQRRSDSGSSTEAPDARRRNVPGWTGWLIVGGSVGLGIGYSNSHNQWVLPPLFGAAGLVMWLYLRTFGHR